MKAKLIQLISLFLLMLVTGVFWGTWFTLTRSIETFSAAEFIHIGKTIIANVAIPMRIIMPSCILFMILSLLFYSEKKSSGFYFCVTAFILIVITLLITLFILVPIDNQIKVWAASNMPADWVAIRTRWQFFHTVRTITSLASFGCFAISVLNTK
jgi:uncharacterized membrane protein